MSITTVGIVGAGTMGNGIAQACAMPLPMVPAPTMPTVLMLMLLFLRVK